MPDKNNDMQHRQHQIELANKLIQLENDKLDIRKSNDKIALENADKSDERLFKIEQERNAIQKDVINKNDKHRTRIFYSSLFFITIILGFVFYLVLKENKLGISILTHFLSALFSGIAFYFYGKNKQQ